MQQEIEALLAASGGRSENPEIEAQITALDPSLVEFDKSRDQVLSSLAKAEIAVAAEEKKQRELHARLAQHKQMQERNLHHLDDVKRMREATSRNGAGRVHPPADGRGRGGDRDSGATHRV